MLIAPSSPQETKVLEIPSGAGLKEIARLLKKNELMDREWEFISIAWLTGAERHLQTGEYQFHTRMSPLEILDILRSGKILLYEVTIPEGFNMFGIARLLSEKGLASYEGFIGLAEDLHFVHSLGIEADSVEGYLYPETYFFPKRFGAEDIIRKMVETFQSLYTTEMKEKASAFSMTQNQVVTLASIIEKETSVEYERPLISAVFHNRLRKGIRLQSDPTVIYALSNFDGNLRKRDLLIHSPYNTYRFRGLPPGPIANPSQLSLLAVLYPAETNDLYFVSKNDGTHQFSETLSEHERAVDRYQKRRVKRGQPRP